ncbi:A-kinase anchor protein inhibitor 1 [Crocuta crocuta]
MGTGPPRLPSIPHRALLHTPSCHSFRPVLFTADIHDPERSGDEGHEGQQSCEKPANEPEEVKLQKASKQIVQNVILQAVQQVSQESQQRDGRPADDGGSFRLGVGELTKKHEKK